MYTHSIKKLPKNTIELSIVVPQSDIASEYKKAFERVRKETTIEGFRKGKAPAEIAKKHIKREDVYNQMLQSYIPTIYSEIVTKEKLKPIISPKLNLKKAQENADWELVISVAEAPKVSLGNYKEKVKTAIKKVEKSDIWVPGKDKEPTNEDKEKQKQAKFQAALGALLAEAKAEISDLIIEDELNQRLARIVDDVQKIGLTMEKYLESKKISQADFRKQIQDEITETYKMEFVLQKVADEEGIQVEKKELEDMLSTVKDAKEKEALQKNMYYYASLLRKQKTIDYISSL